ncbi:MAG: histidine kinase, partial [Clostridia bacterium]
MLHLVNMFQQNALANKLLSATPVFASGEHIRNQMQLWQLLYTMLDGSDDYLCRIYADPNIGITDDTSLILSMDSVRQDEWMQEALRGWGWWRFNAGSTMDSVNPALVAPIRDLEEHATLRAVLRIDMKQEALQRMLALPPQHSYLSCYLETNGGDLVYESRENVSRIPLAALMPATVTGFDAMKLTRMIRDTNTVLYQTLPRSRWRLVVIIDAQALFENQLPRFLMLLLSASALALCGILFAFPVIWTTVLRIRRFYRQVQSIGETELHQRISPVAYDEVGQLIVAHNKLLDRIEALIKERGEREKELRRLEISALQAQIKPHFLYNTLDAISWMSKRDENEKVDQTIRSLIHFYRLCLSHGSDVLPVSKELEIVQYYCDIQRIRYRDVFRMEIDVSAEVQQICLPKITLQPLVENALMHGILESGMEEGVVRIFSRISSTGKIELCVADSGAHFSPEAWERALRCTPDNGLEEGYGLMNVERRLCLFMAATSVMHLDLSQSALTCIVIPLT